MKEASSTPQPPTPASRASFSLATVLYNTVIILSRYCHDTVTVTLLSRHLASCSATAPESCTTSVLVSAPAPPLFTPRQLYTPACR